MTAAAVELSGERRASYEMIGSGPPLLMFPGGPGGSAAYLRPKAELLTDRFTAYLIDPHGSGRSTPPADPGGYGFEGHARFYDEVRQALGMERASVYGFSFGGGVALTYAALYPQVTEHCFSVSFGGSREGPSVAEERERALARHAGAPWYQEARAALDGASSDDIDAMLRSIMPLYFARPDRPDIRPRVERLRRLSRLNVAGLEAWESGLHQPADVDPFLPQIEAPTVIVAGELDFACTPTQARRLAASVSTARLILVPECGHCVAEEAPDIFREGIAVRMA